VIAAGIGTFVAIFLTQGLIFKIALHHLLRVVWISSRRAYPALRI